MGGFRSVTHNLAKYRIQVQIPFSSAPERYCSIIFMHLVLQLSSVVDPIPEIWILAPILGKAELIAGSISLTRQWRCHWNETHKWNCWTAENSKSWWGHHIWGAGGVAEPGISSRGWAEQSFRVLLLCQSSPPWLSAYPVATVRQQNSLQGQQKFVERELHGDAGPWLGWRMETTAPLLCPED